MRKILIGALFLCCVAMAHGQTISPVVSECGRKCSGEFSIKNNSVQPLAVTLQPYSFTLDAKTGHSIFRPLDSSVDLRLDEMAARVGPKAEHSFGYRIRCNQTPCLVTIMATMTIGHTVDGIGVRVQLPTVLYACERQKNCRAEVRKEAGL